MHSILIMRGDIVLPCQFRDPIHGFIEVSDLELKIVDSAPFQRLRNIKQLATTYLVYPGAEHTRFGHSLGVMHLATKAFESAVENYSKTHAEPLFDEVTQAWYRQILRLIALTHDLGHAPFSHGSEGLFGEGTVHEDYTKKILYETEIAQQIKAIGEDFQAKHSVGKEYSITPQLLWLIYGQKNPELDPQYIMPDFKFLKSFMDSELDCDKMDYLLRDSYYCGVNYGKYDLNRLLSSLSVYTKKDHHIMQLAVERGGIHAFEEFVIARYFMFIQVYFHKTRRYLDILLVQNIANVLPDNRYPEDVNEYLALDDLTVIDRIKRRQEVDVIAEDFMKRHVMTCVYETKTHSNLDGDYHLYKIISQQLRDRLDCDIIKDTANKPPHKLPVLEAYDAESGKGIPILVQHMDEPTSIAAESILLQSLVKSINIRRIYVAKKYAKKAKEVVAELLKAEEENE